MQASIQLPTTGDTRYLLRLADTCLIHGQRLAEWCGHAPALEEDIALANMALDLVGQARALLTLAGTPHRLDEDQLAFLREERDYFNLTLAELPNSAGGPSRPGDFALTTLRNLMLAVWFRLLWERLTDSRGAELAAIAGKAVKEARYHVDHSADWVVRLGDGTDESRRRMQTALDRLWPYTAELFDDDATDTAAEDSGLGVRPSSLSEAWQRDVGAVLAAATLAVPASSAFLSHGKRGRHTEHMGFMLAEMQHLQRAYPGGVW